MAKRDADGRNDHQIDLLAGGRIRGRWRSWHATGCCRSPKCCGGLLFVFGGASPGSAGVPPAPYSFGPRERGHPAHLGARASRPHPIPANSLPSTATPLQGAPNPPLRGSLPSCRGLCGRDARAPRWSCAGGTPALPGGLCAGGTPALPGGLCAGGTPALPGDHSPLEGGNFRLIISDPFRSAVHY